MTDPTMTPSTPPTEAVDCINVRFDGGPLIALGFDGRVWLIRDDRPFGAGDLPPRDAYILRAMLEHALDKVHAVINAKP